MGARTGYLKKKIPFLLIFFCALYKICLIKGLPPRDVCKCAKIYQSVFIKALFVIGKYWKQLKYSSLG